MADTATELSRLEELVIRHRAEATELAENSGYLRKKRFKKLNNDLKKIYFVHLGLVMDNISQTEVDSNDLTKPIDAVWATIDALNDIQSRRAEKPFIKIMTALFEKGYNLSEKYPKRLVETLDNDPMNRFNADRIADLVVTHIKAADYERDHHRHYEEAINTLILVSGIGLTHLFMDTKGGKEKRNKLRDIYCDISKASLKNDVYPTIMGHGPHGMFLVNAIKKADDTNNAERYGVKMCQYVEQFGSIRDLVRSTAEMSSENNEAHTVYDELLQKAHEKERNHEVRDVLNVLGMPLAEGIKELKGDQIYLAAYKDLCTEIIARVETVEGQGIMPVTNAGYLIKELGEKLPTIDKLTQLKDFTAGLKDKIAEGIEIARKYVWTEVYLKWQT